MSRQRFIGWLALLASVAFPAAAATELPQVLVSAPRDADVVGLAMHGTTLAIDVAGPGGIGSADLRLLAGDWPQRVELRFHGLPELEGLRAHAGGRVLRCDLLRFPGLPPRHACLFDGRPAESVTQAHGTHALALPAALLPPPGETLRIEWADRWR